MSESTSGQSGESYEPVDRELTEGSLRYDERYSHEFSELLSELRGVAETDPERIRKPETYVSDATSDLDWGQIRGTDLLNHFSTIFGDPDTAAGLGLDRSQEFPFDQADLKDACRAVLDLEAVARSAGEEDLAERALDLAARYASHYGLPAGGETRVRQVKLGLVRDR